MTNWSPTSEPSARPTLSRPTDRKIGGVAAGLAKLFSIPATVVRLAFVALALIGGAGFLLYLGLWVLAPSEESLEPGQDVERSTQTLILGSGLVGGGLLLLLATFGGFEPFGLLVLSLLFAGIVLLNRRPDGWSVPTAAGVSPASSPGSGSAAGSGPVVPPPPMQPTDTIWDSGTNWVPPVPGSPGTPPPSDTAVVSIDPAWVPPAEPTRSDSAGTATSETDPTPESEPAVESGSTPESEPAVESESESTLPDIDDLLSTTTEMPSATTEMPLATGDGTEDSDGGSPSSSSSADDKLTTPPDLPPPTLDMATGQDPTIGLETGADIGPMLGLDKPPGLDSTVDSTFGMDSAFERDSASSHYAVEQTGLRPHWAVTRTAEETSLSSGRSQYNTTPITSIVLASMLAVLGVALVLNTLAGIFVGAVTVTGIGLVIVGGGIAVTSYRGATLPLLPIAAVLLLGLLASPTIDHAIEDGTGSRNIAVSSMADLEQNYALGVGEIILDLRQLELTEDATVNIELGTGGLEVWLPRDMAAEVNAETTVGYAWVLGEGRGGINPQIRLLPPLSTEADAPRLFLNAETTIGGIDVYRG